MVSDFVDRKFAMLTVRAQRVERGRESDAMPALEAVHDSPRRAGQAHLDALDTSLLNPLRHGSPAELDGANFRVDHPDGFGSFGSKPDFFRIQTPKAVQLQRRQDADHGAWHTRRRDRDEVVFGWLGVDARVKPTVHPPEVAASDATIEKGGVDAGRLKVPESNNPQFLHQAMDNFSRGTVRQFQL